MAPALRLLAAEFFYIATSERASIQPQPAAVDVVFQMLSLYSGCEVLGYVKSVQDVGTDVVDLDTFTREEVRAAAAAVVLIVLGRLFAELLLQTILCTHFVRWATRPSFCHA